MIALIERDDADGTSETQTNAGGSLFGAGASTPYASGGGFSVPSIGTTFQSPGQMAAPSGPPADVSPSIPFVSQVLAAADASMAGASGTPTYSPSGASDAGSPAAVVPSVPLDYFNKVVDVVKAQLQAGAASAPQSFAAPSIALPSGGSYAGTSDGGDTTAAASSRRSWLGLVVLVAAAGAAYYWFVYRKKHGGAA